MELEALQSTAIWACATRARAARTNSRSVRFMIWPPVVAVAGGSTDSTPAAARLRALHSREPQRVRESEPANQRARARSLLASRPRVPRTLDAGPWGERFATLA